MRPTAISHRIFGREKRYDLLKAIPRMSWSPENTYNIWQRSTDGAKARDISFTETHRSLYQQRFKAKTMLKGYHADFIRTKQFERWYLPSRLPAIHVKKSLDSESSKFVEGRERAGGRTLDERRAEKKKETSLAPVGSMMFSQVERRLDVCVFRSLFAKDVYSARQYVIHGHVKLNGQTIYNPNTLLNPGDLFTVNPNVIPFLKPKNSKGKVAEKKGEAVKSSKGAETQVTKSKKEASTSFFNLPPFAQCHMFVPAYILPSFLTCSAVYVRHPTARANYSEIATPFDAGGLLMSLGWEWYSGKAPRMRSKITRWMNPQRDQERARIPRGD